MSIEFNNGSNFNYNYRPSYSNNSGGITKLVIKWGLAKDEKGANTIMVIFSIICIVLAFYIGF